MIDARILLVALGLSVVAGGAAAENRNFNFSSPAFGGDPVNGTYFFGVAQAQLGATNRNPEAGGVGGIGGGGGPTVGNGGTVGGPTIIIPINTGQPQAPDVTTGATSEATVDQVSN